MAELTDALAIDCEMVEIKKKGHRCDRVARVSLVNERGETVYNHYVRPGKCVRITNYRTNISGITAKHLATGHPFPIVREKVRKLIKKRILVGHVMNRDLHLLNLQHPWWNKRDSAEYFKTNRGRPSLKNLAAQHLNMSIQNGAHDSIEDARAAMALYKKYEQEWDQWMQSDSEEGSDEEYGEEDSGEYEEDSGEYEEDSEEYEEDSEEYEEDSEEYEEDSGEYEEDSEEYEEDSEEYEEDSEEGSGEEDSEEGSGEEDSEEGSGEEDSEEGSGEEDSEEGSGEEDSEEDGSQYYSSSSSD